MKPISDTTPQTAVDPHISRSIDIIRGAAALGVIWGHSMYGLSLPVELNGAFWVWIFLPISGYLVGRGFTTGGYEFTARGFGRFLLNRALRIVPLAYVALVIGLAVCIVSGTKIPEDTIRQFLFVPDGNNMSLIGPLWTVAAEIQFYLMAVILVPLVHRVWLMGGLLSGMLLFVAAAYLGFFWVRYTGDVAIQPRTFFGNIALFMFGLLLARMNVVKLHAARYYKLLVVISLIIIVWWLQNYNSGYFWMWGPHPWPLSGAIAIAMIIVATALLISPSDQKPDIWRKGVFGYLADSSSKCNS